MPSVYNTFSNTQAKINASNTFNLAAARAKAGGTATTNFNESAIAGEPAIFNGDANDGITDDLVSSTGVAGLALSYAAGSAIGAAAEQRQLSEIDIANNNIDNQSGQYVKTSDTEVITTGLTRLRNGTLVDSNGDAASPTSSGISYEITASLGDIGADTDRTQEYNFRMGLTNSQVTLETRTQ